MAAKSTYLGVVKRHAVGVDQIIGFTKICIGKPQWCQGKVGTGDGL